MSITNIRFFDWREMTWVAVAAFAYLGITSSPVYFGAAFILSGSALANRRKVAGHALAAFGLLYFLLAFGYGIGKDLALREASASGKAELSLDRT